MTFIAKFYRDVWRDEKAHVVEETVEDGEILLFSRLATERSKPHHNFVTITYRGDWVASYKRDAETREWRQANV